MTTITEDGVSSVDFSEGVPEDGTPSEEDDHSRSISPSQSRPYSPSQSSSSDSSPLFPHPPITPPLSHPQSLFAPKKVTPQAAQQKTSTSPDLVPKPIITQLIDRLPPEVKTLPDMVRYFHSSAALGKRMDLSDGCSSSRPMAHHLQRRAHSSPTRESIRRYGNRTLLPQEPRLQAKHRQAVQGGARGGRFTEERQIQPKSAEGGPCAEGERDLPEHAASARPRRSPSRSPFTWLCNQCSRRISHAKKCAC